MLENQNTVIFEVVKKYQKTALIEAVGKSKDGDYIVQNEGDPSDLWTIPKDVFEKTYKEVNDEECKGVGSSGIYNERLYRLTDYFSLLCKMPQELFLDDASLRLRKVADEIEKELGI